MFKFELMTVKDIKEAAAIERRRQNEEERRKRIFNARNRLIGVDKAALEKQIAEKHAKGIEEKQKEELFASQLIRDSLVARELAGKEAEERRKINEEINIFRLKYQKPEDRREFDLYDPNGLKKSLPPRIKDNDPSLGPSSAQKFEGEDLVSEARKRQQMDQQRAWLKQQMDETKAADRERKFAEEAYQEALVARDRRACELERLEKECRRRLDEANARYNKALAQEREQQEKINAVNDLEDKHAEMYNLMTSDMLAENPDVAQSNLGASRKIAFMSKGMTREQLAEFYRLQKQQIDDKVERKLEEERYNKDWEKFMLETDKTMSQLERETLHKQRELNKKITNENIELSKEQKARKEYLKQVVYKNTPTAEYYQQFNTSTR